MDRADVDIVIRQATASDLRASYEVQCEASAAAGMEIGNVVGDAPGTVPSKFRHELGHGRFLVAEVDRRIEGFGAIFERGDVTFLATFYVRPGSQNAGLGIGQRLLDALFEGSRPVRSLVSSQVHRALAIYARNDLLPRWPLFMLEGRSDLLSLETPAKVSIKPADPDDSDLVEWDAEIAGRGARRDDQRFWLRDYAAEPYWIVRNGRRVGYGYIQNLFQSSDAPWHPDTVKIGQIGVRDVSDSKQAVVALAGEARRIAPRVTIDIPGAHPALPALLDAGFRIHYQATYCSNTPMDIFDPTRYIPGDTIAF